MPTHEQMLNMKMDTMQHEMNELREMIDEIREDYYSSDDGDTDETVSGDSVKVVE